MHSREPLHRIEVFFNLLISFLRWRSFVTKIWTGFYFKRVGLKELGLRIQLGHHHGKPCKNPERSFANTFILLDIDGIHEVSVDFCGCENILPHYIQILRARWFPATVLQPRTAATFRLLHFFHILSLQAGISAYEFYTSLARRTSNTGLEVPKVRKDILCYTTWYSQISLVGPLYGIYSDDSRMEPFEAFEASGTRS